MPKVIEWNIEERGKRYKIESSLAWFEFSPHHEVHDILQILVQNPPGGLTTRPLHTGLCDSLLLTEQWIVPTFAPSNQIRFSVLKKEFCLPVYHRCRSIITVEIQFTSGISRYVFAYTGCKLVYRLSDYRVPTPVVINYSVIIIRADLVHVSFKKVRSKTRVISAKLWSVCLFGKPTVHN